MNGGRRGDLPEPGGTCFDRRMRKLAVVVPVVLGLAAPQAAEAQSYEAPKPIEVPTTPVPQSPPPATPPPKKAEPKPAPAPTTATPKKGDDPPKDDKAEKKPVNYNNDGVFKVSGTGTNLAAPKGTPAKGGGTAPAGKPGKVAKANAAIVAQWPGFRMTEDGGSEVMVEFSKNVAPPSRFEAAGTVTFVFKGAIVLKHNNQNPLLTGHFNTPVSSARLVPKKGELHLVIDLRAATSAAGTTGMRAGGEPGSMQFFAKFPAGSYLAKDADDEPMLKPSTTKLKGTGKDASKSEAPPPPPEKKPTGGAKPGPKE